MRAVWKFILQETDEPQLLHIPYGAELLHVGVQQRKLCLWAEVDTEAERVPWSFLITMTGQHVPVDADYLATAQDGPYVLHLWQLP